MNSECVVDVGYGAKPTDAGVRGRRAVFSAMICQRERHVAEAESDFSGVGILRRVKGRGDRRKDAALEPGGRLSVRAECGLEIHRRNRVERIKLDVVFAAPDHLDWLSGFLGEHSRFDYKIRE